MAAPRNRSDNVPLVALVEAEGSEVDFVSHSYTDKRTWYPSSVRVTGEILALDAGTTFASAHPWWIALDRGLVFDEDAYASEQPHGYAVRVYDNGIELTPRAPFASSGGDYTIDHAAGKVTLAQAPQGAVTVDYSYATDSVWVMRPTPGRALRILHAELDVSEDVEMRDAIVVETMGLAEVFAPGLGLPAGTLIPLQTQRYKTYRQIQQHCLGSLVSLPPIGGPTRGTSVAWRPYPFPYRRIQPLRASTGMELRVSLETHAPFTGENATATFYCASMEESALLALVDASP